MNFGDWTTVRAIKIITTVCEQGRTGPLGCLTLARWAGWSAGLVGRHIKCCRREWNGGGGLGPLTIYTYIEREGSTWILVQGTPSSKFRH